MFRFHAICYLPYTSEYNFSVWQYLEGSVLRVSFRRVLLVLRSTTTEIISCSVGSLHLQLCGFICSHHVQDVGGLLFLNVNVKEFAASENGL